MNGGQLTPAAAALYTQLDEARRSAAAAAARVDVLERSLAVVTLDGEAGPAAAAASTPPSPAALAFGAGTAAARFAGAASATTGLPPPATALGGDDDDGGADGPGGGGLMGETALVPRAALELLKLKDLAMDSVVEGITIADAALPDMPLIYANRAFARITGYSVAETLGKNCRFLQGAGTDADEVATLRAAVKGGRPCVVQLLNYRKNGDPFVNYLSVTPIHDARGVLTHYVGVQSDITELVASRKAALAARHAAQTAAAATEAKSQFLARMSHEIRTPLNGMIAVGQLLAETALTPAQWDLVNTIRCSGESLLTLISDILDFSRAEADAVALAPAPFALQATVEAAVEIAGLLAAHKRLHMAYHIHAGVPPVLVGDAARLQQVLLNILNNAVKFTEVGGVVLEVWVGGGGGGGAGGEDGEGGGGGGGGEEEGGAAAGPSPAGPPAEPAPPPPSASSTHRLPPISTKPAGLPPLPPPPPDAVRVRFAVRDTGIGLAPADLPRLFQSFSQVDASPTRRHGGSGLGLAISQKLCQAMGGAVAVKSDGPGKGSTFTWSVSMRLPSPGGARPPPLPPGGGPAASSPGGLVYGKKILLLEPCSLIRSVLVRALARWGAAVCAVGSEAEAVGRVAGGQRPVEPPPPPPACVSPPPDDASRPPGYCALSLRDETPGGTASTPPAASNDVAGPFDVVVMDTGAASLLRALLHAPPSEASRIVFMGWPGRHEMEAPGTPVEDGGGALAPPLPVGAAKASAAAPPTLPDAATTTTTAGGASSRHRSGRRLTYAVLTRPVRQARLWVALEEVLTAPPPGEDDEGEEESGDEGAEVEPPATAAAASLPASRTASGALSSGGGRPPPRSASSIDLAAGDHMHRIASGGCLCRAPPSRARRDSGAAGGLRPGLGVLGGGNGGGGGLVTPPPPPPASQLVRATSGQAGVLSAAAAAAAPPPPAWASAAPAPAAAPPSTTTAPPPPNEGTGGLRVLVAEDNAINMRVAVRVLARMGHTRVTLAEDGQAALDAVAATPGGLAAFDVVLMDLHMPRMGGLEAVAALRRTYPGARATRIVAVTADAFDHTRDACLAAGFDGWVAKPFRVEDLEAALGGGGGVAVGSV